MAYKSHAPQHSPFHPSINPPTHSPSKANRRFPSSLQPMEAGGPTTGGAATVKNSWPEVVGLSSEEAKKKIMEDKPEASVQVVPADAFVTMDHNIGRVRVFVDSNDKVAKVPKIG